MFATSSPAASGVLLPGYPATRVVMAAALSPGGGIPVVLLLGMFVWLAAVLGLTVWRLSVGLRTASS